MMRGDIKAVWCLLLTFTVTVLRPGSCVEFDMDEEIDSMVCPPLRTQSSTILDIHKSMDLGAKLVEGTWQSSLDSCVSQCCLNDDCDMALYKNQGVSQSGKNCYFAQCGKPENCVVVEHSGFTSVSLEKPNAGDSSKEDPTTKTLQSDSTETESSDSSVERSDVEPSPPASDFKPVTRVTVTPDSSSSTTIAEKGDSQKGSKEVSPSKTPPTTTSPPMTNNSTDKGENKNSSDENTVEESNKALSSSSKDGGSESHVSTQDCGKYGCDGSGLIAVAVVGSICFAIVVLVVAVLLKRVVDDKRRKRFNNVDYLINGMYT